MNENFGLENDGYKTREEHLAWCKRRALEYLDLPAYEGRMPNQDDIRDACASMLSDLGKHSGTARLQELGFLLMMAVRTPDEARRFVEGFN